MEREPTVKVPAKLALVPERAAMEALVMVALVKVPLVKKTLLPESVVMVARAVVKVWMSAEVRVPARAERLPVKAREVPTAVPKVEEVEFKVPI